MASNDRIVVERFATTDLPPQHRYDEGWLRLSRRFGCRTVPYPD